MIDKFGRKIDYLRISVTENCNLKCIYCIDENSILNSCNNDILTDDEIVKIATECARLGIKKIRITDTNMIVTKSIKVLAVGSCKLLIYLNCLILIRASSITIIYSI